MQIGDVLVRTNAVPTANLGEAVARQYGIERGTGTVMLLVGVRREGDAGETALPARVTAVASDLLGKRQQLELREVRSGDPGPGPGQGFIDSVGNPRAIERAYCRASAWQSVSRRGVAISYKKTN